jgi:SAM-dependent methyltransferase
MKAECKQLESASARPDAASLVHDKVLSLLQTEKPGLLLDVPAGEGAFALKARESGHEIRCADIDVSRFKVQGIACDHVDLNKPWPYTSSMFDCVVSIEAIEHLENPWHLVREANRVLKRGGKLIITTPNILTIKSRLSYLLYGYPNYFHYMVERYPDRRDESPIDHINPVSFLELRHILSRNGFQIEAIEANRYSKRYSLFYQLLRLLLFTRGGSDARNDKAKASVRQTLLSAVLLFGEILVLKAQKVSDVKGM